jgi:chlorophyll synthase
MDRSATQTFERPAPAAVLELLKPITWFAPMWAFACGIISSGQPILAHWPVILAGVLVAGPLVCGTSQAVNDWYDREVDAINQPDRPIPSGRIPGSWGFWIAVVWSGLSVLVATALGVWGFVAALLGLTLAWMYSAPPARLKRSGWWGPGTVALCYEGVPWFTGAAIMTASFPDWRIVTLAVLYSVGAHGIMTLNDFKAVEGDRATGVRSLPAVMGTRAAAWLSCAVMALPQVVVIVLLYQWDRPVYGGAVATLLLIQFALMARLMKDPQRFAPWYNATGTTLYVIGMMVSAFAVGSFMEGL